MDRMPLLELQQKMAHSLHPPAIFLFRTVGDLVYGSTGSISDVARHIFSVVTICHERTCLPYN